VIWEKGNIFYGPFDVRFEELEAPKNIDPTTARINLPFPLHDFSPLVKAAETRGISLQKPWAFRAVILTFSHFGILETKK
jgi:hypothetical protein